MSGRSKVAVILVGFAAGLSLGCAGKARGSKSPAECMSACDQEQCQYRADGLGDNDAYLECLEACEDKCGIASEAES